MAGYPKENHRRRNPGDRKVVISPHWYAHLVWVAYFLWHHREFFLRLNSVITPQTKEKSMTLTSVLNFFGLLIPALQGFITTEESQLQTWIQAELAKDGLPPEVNAFLTAIDAGLTALVNTEIQNVAAKA